MKAWTGNWYERLEQRARERGFDTVTSFANSQPTATLLNLADQLGKEDVAATQLEKVLVDEAEATGSIERCARSLLVRELHAHLPEGWHIIWDDRELGSAFRRAGVFADWSTTLGTRYKQPVTRVWKALRAAPIPEGWLPAGPDDPILLEAFKHWNDPE